MGGQGSGMATKGPHHTYGEYLFGRERSFLKNQVKHQKSLFSDKLDPSLHRSKRWREKQAKIANGTYNPEEEKMAEIVRKKRCIEAREIQELARQNADDMMKVIMDIAKNDELQPSARLQAANIILDRAYGKAAVTTLNINADMNTNPRDLDDAGLSKRIAETIANIERLRDMEAKTIEGEARPLNLREYN